MSEELRRGIPKAVLVGHIEYSKEEQEKHDRDFEKLLKERGVLAEYESIKDFKLNRKL